MASNNPNIERLQALLKEINPDDFLVNNVKRALLFSKGNPFTTHPKWDVLKNSIKTPAVQTIYGQVSALGNPDVPANKQKLGK